MGKCIRRTMKKSQNDCLFGFGRRNSSLFMTREKALSSVFGVLNTKTKKKTNLKEAINTISLFGISAEELSEAGMAYENLKALGSVIE